MSVDVINIFLRGALWACSWIAAVFFARYWRLERDRFFLFFSGAFFLLGVNFLGLLAVLGMPENRHYVYVLRLIAFLLILAAVLDKNRRAKLA